MKRFLLPLFALLFPITVFSQWLSLGTGTNGKVLALEADSAAQILWVGGNFTTAGGVNTTNIARWNGGSWQAAGNGLQGEVRALKIFNNQLVAGGVFNASGPTSLSNIALWDGTAWQPMGNGLNGAVNCLEVFNNQLYAAGVFTASGTTSVANIARWNGTAWEAVGTGITGGSPATVFTLQSFNGVLYVGGQFTSAGGQSSPNFAGWNGTAWVSFTSPLNNGVFGMDVTPNRLYIGGSGLSNLVAFNGASFALPPSNTNGPVRAVFTDGNLIYAGGSFTAYGNPSQGKYFGRTNGSSWFTVGGSPDSTILAIEKFQGRIIAAGVFDSIGTSGASFIAQWLESSPIGDFSIPDTTICVGDCVQFANLTTGDATSYSWSFQGGSPSTSDAGVPPPVCYANPGTYSVFLEVSNPTGTSTRAKLAYVVVNDLPVPVISSNGTVLTSTPAAAYQWFRSGISIPGAIQQNFTPQLSGEYTVTVTDINGCTGTSAPFTYNFIGVQNPYWGHLEAYPNPASTHVQLSSSEGQSFESVSWFNLHGQQLATTTGSIAPNTFIPVPESLSNGLYLLKIQTGAHTATLRIYIMR